MKSTTSRSRLVSYNGRDLIARGASGSSDRDLAAAISRVL